MIVKILGEFKMALPIRKKVFDVAGEGQKNEDGTPRQEIIAGCEPGDIVTLVREPKNPYDENAIRIDYKHEAIGYINKSDAAKLAPILDADRKHTAIIHKLKGGVSDYPKYGVEISIAWDDRSAHPFVLLDEAQERFKEKHENAGGCLGVIIFFAAVMFIVNLSNHTPV